MTDYKALIPFAGTTKQIKILELLDSGLSVPEIEKQHGIVHQVTYSAIKSVKKRAALQGYSPDHDMVHLVPDPYIAKGISTYYNKDGKPSAQWVKSALSNEKHQEMLKEAADLFYADLPRIEVPPAIEQEYDTDIIPWFQIGDAHIGMLAHEAETGHNFDLKIAVTELMTAFQILFDDTKPAERCVINDLGDFSHFENYEGVTAHSGHQLDCDTRFHKMIGAYIPLMRFIIDEALKKFKFVDIIINQGNHSRTNDIWMALLLKNVYENTDRVTVLPNANVFIPYRMGNTFVMVHHTDKCKPGKLQQVMATDYAKEWGECQFRYIDTGHVHHGFVSKEHPGVLLESWNNLAASDKYAHEGGWRSKQSITRVDRSRSFGNVGRRTLSIEEVHSRIKKGLNKHVKKGYKQSSSNKVFTV